MGRTFLAASFFIVLYLVGVVFLNAYQCDIFTQASPFNDVVRVTENFKGVRHLKFGTDDAVQSYYDTRNPEAVLSPYVRVTLEAFDRVVGPVRRVLVVGMGGGTQGMAARRRFPDADIDLIEVCPVVAKAAVDLLGLTLDPRMQVHVQDGLQFIEGSPHKYDLIFIDAFNGVEPPPHLITQRFFAAVKNRLAPGGVVAANVVYRDISPAYDLIVARTSAVFGAFEIAQVPGGAHNRVLFTFPL